MKDDLSTMLHRLNGASTLPFDGPEALVRRTLARHGLAGPAPAPAHDNRAKPAAGTSQMTRHRTTTAQGSRDWYLHRPSRPAARAGVVMMLHGCTQSAEDFARGTNMNAVADARGWSVVWPEQTADANPMRCWNWFGDNLPAADTGEPHILAAIARDATALIGAPNADVFVAGLSAGGAMAALMAEAYPGLIRAAAVHSGLPAGAATSLQGAMGAMRGGAAGRTPVVPMIVLHGTADRTVSPLNGAALAAGIEGRSTGGATGGRRWTLRKGKAGEYWQIEGLAHAWSGGDAQGSYTDPAGPDASAEIARFFAEQQR